MKEKIESKLDDIDVSFLKDKVILVTGGTGSFGKKFTEIILTKTQARKLIIFSRDELKQSEMAASIKDNRVRFFLGDVRNRARLERAFKGVDFVVHAAALKQVPILEYNPFEAVLTNILGTQNVIDAAIDQGVSRAVFISTDKAVNPINLYGATKLCAEKLFINGNVYSGDKLARFSIVRYGNVIGSRGSVVPLFLKKKKDGVLPITHKEMTRFWITLEQGVHLVLNALYGMNGGEIYIPKVPSMKLTDLAKAIASKCKWEFTGVRPGEKIHEALMTDEEIQRGADIGSCIVIPPISAKNAKLWTNGGKPLPKNFKYSSDKTQWQLSSEELLAMVKAVS
ncbi:UDP-N-acetylglucosamine 4,6-dehydratase (inverting) [Elusimicrobiota bacterium]